MIEFDGMSRPEITKILSISTEKNINPNNDTRIYWAKEVTFDYSTTAAGRVKMNVNGNFKDNLMGKKKVIFIVLK